MDWNTIIVSLVGSGILATIAMGIIDRRIKSAQAQQTERQSDGTVVDYAGKIIEQTDKIIMQSDKRIERAEAEAQKWLDKISETEAYAKEQRMKNNELRDENIKLRDTAHKAELAVAGIRNELVEAKYARCTDDTCRKRVPPRKFDAVRLEKSTELKHK